MVKTRDLCTGGRSVEESRSVKVCELVPAVFGVPVIAPVVVLNPRLGGSGGVTDHVYGVVPPEPLTDAEKDWLTVPSGSEEVRIVRASDPPGRPQPIEPRT